MSKTLNVKLAQLSIALACAAMMAACGGGSDGGSPSPGTDSSADAGNSGGADTPSGNTDNPGNGDSAKLLNFEPTSTIDVAVDAAKEQEYGGVPPTVVSYVMHQANGEVVTINAQRYGDQSNDSSVSRSFYIDLGADQLQLGFSGVEHGSNSWSMRPNGGQSYANFNILMTCPEEGASIAIPAGASVTSDLGLLQYWESSPRWPLGVSLLTCDSSGLSGVAMSLDSAGNAEALISPSPVTGWDAKVFSEEGWTPEPGVHWKAQLYRAVLPTGSAGAMEEQGFLILKINENGKFSQYLGFGGT